MPASDRWLLVASAAFVFLTLAVIQIAATAQATGSERAIIVNRLLGIPFLLVLGFLGELEAQWVAFGVLGVCLAVLIADLSSGSDIGESEREVALE
jgi:hypothetical protein